MNNDLFQLLDTNIKFSFDPEELIKNLPVFEWDDIAPDKTHLKRIENNPHLASGVFNFYKDFPNEVMEIIFVLEELKIKMAALPQKSEMVKYMISSPIKPEYVHLLIINSHYSVGPHCDRRKYSFNIGLKNSSTRETIIYDGPVVRPNGSKIPILSEKNNKFSFIMNDGDAYILDAGRPHGVNNIAPNDKDRFIMTYAFY